MPANPRSLSVTDAYRERMVGLRERAVALARTEWAKLTLENFDASYGPLAGRLTEAVSHAQREGTRLSAAYVAAYVASELGHRVRTPAPSATHIGLSRDGRPLREAFDSPRIGVLAALKKGDPDALKVGLERAVRMVGVDTDHASRASLNEVMESHPQVKGWQRAVRGTCGACVGDVAVETTVNLPSIPLRIHPNCQCVTEPVVTRSRFGEPTSKQVEAAQWYETGYGVADSVALRAAKGDISALSAEAQDRIRAVTSLIDEQAQAAPVLYRTGDWSLLSNKAAFLGRGRTFREWGVSACAETREFAEHWASIYRGGIREPVIFRIEGAKGVSIKKLAERQGWDLESVADGPELSEWWLRPGTEFRVKQFRKVKRGGKTVREVTIEAVG